MTEQRGEENLPRDGEAGPEPDLRSIMSGGTRRATPWQEPQPPAPPGDAAPSAPDDDDAQRQPRHRVERLGRPFEEQAKPPPVWPGDEDQPWFRRERGLPPISEGYEAPALNPEDFPTPLADIPTRGRAFGVGVLLPNIIGLIPTIGFIVGTIVFVANLLLYRQGQDVGAAIFRLRVVRDNGDVAGFFQMWVRSMASIVSLLALGAGFWTAFSDPYFRTWHDKWLGTYVVKDSEEYKTRKRSSSETARRWFWITLLLFIAISVLLTLASVPPTDTTPAA